MKLGVDCSQDTTPHIPALTAYGVEFVCRYVSTPGNSKNITAAEVTALLAAGIDVKIVFETSSDRARSGAAMGTEDAHVALAQAQSVGLPNVIIYFAVDYNDPLTDEPGIEAYIAAANAAITNPVGVYGKYALVEHCLDKALVTEAWQTYAWSIDPATGQGQLSLRSQIWQVLNGQTIGGLPVDINIGRF